TDADETSAEQWFGVGDLRRRAPPRLLGILFGNAVEELVRLRREQAHLFLLDEYCEHRFALARLDHEDAMPRLAVGTRADLVDRIELDELGHDDSDSPRASGSGKRSSRPPVSLHFTIITPYVWKSNTVTDAGDTLMRWNESRCMPV